MSDPTLPTEPEGSDDPTEGRPGDLPEAASPDSDVAVVPDRPQRRQRLELAGALVTGVVGLETLALLIGITSGRYASVGDRIEILSLNLDAKMGLILLAGAILVTLPDTLELQPAASRSKLATRTLYAITGLGGVIAVLALIGIGLDLSRDVTSFGTNQGAAVIHRLAILLMAIVTCGWSLAALGVRVITARR